MPTISAKVFKELHNKIMETAYPDGTEKPEGTKYLYGYDIPVNRIATRMSRSINGKMNAFAISKMEMSQEDADKLFHNEHRSFYDAFKLAEKGKDPSVGDGRLKIYCCYGLSECEADIVHWRVHWEAFKKDNDVKKDNNDTHSLYNTASDTLSSRTEGFEENNDMYISEIKELPVHEEEITGTIHKINASNAQIHTDKNNSLNPSETRISQSSILEKVKRSKTWLYAIGGLLLGLFIAFINPFKKKEPITWYMTTTWDGNSSFICEGLRDLTADVYKNTGGDLRIMISNNLQLPDSGRTVPLTEVLNIISSDAPRVQMLHSSKYHYYTGQSPSSIFFSAIPFGMSYPQTNRWMGEKFLDTEKEGWAEGYRFWRQVNNKTGVISFPCGHSDAQWGGWYKDTIKNINDFKGKKIRMGGLAGIVLDSLGAKNCSLFQYQLLSAMQSDSLFAAEWINAVDDYKMGLYKARSYKWVNDQTWNEPNSMFQLTINRKAFDALPEHFKKVIVDAINNMNKSMISKFSGKKETEDYRKLIQAEGVKFFTLPDSVLHILEKTTSRLLYEHVKKYSIETNHEIDTIYQSYLKICPNLRYNPK